MIGSQTDAAAALAGSLPILSEDGSTRIVYRAGNVVYKVESNYMGEGVNRAEYNKALSKANLPDGVFIPKVALYTFGDVDVIAMEYVRGQAVALCYCADAGDDCDPSCMTDSVFSKVNGFLDDPSGFNTIIKANGDIYLIDLD